MANHMTWSNVSIPLGKMPDDYQEALLSVPFPQGVEALKKLSEDTSGQLGKVIPADIFPYIACCIGRKRKNRFGGTVSYAACIGGLCRNVHSCYSREY